MGIYEELEWRGLIKDCSSPDIKENRTTQKTIRKTQKR